MARYWPEPEKGNLPGVAVLLVNLGTPTAPTPRALRSYLKTFLQDPRVIEMPRFVWQIILRGFILPFRPAKSAAKYKKIWTAQGSPLKVHTERQAQLLETYLRAEPDCASIDVRWAMRYGVPSIPDRLNQLRAEGFNRILVVPLYPQYAASTTGSVMDEVAGSLRHWRNLPEIRYVRSFPEDAGYIEALAQNIRRHWTNEGRPERLVLSFHGLPQKCHVLGDPYPDECHLTAARLKALLEFPPQHILTCFQSRFGRAAWLQPYTQSTLEQLGRDGIQKIDIVCPGFVSDCLETLEEINMECRAAFLSAGGKSFHYIPCLNEDERWIAAMAKIIRRHLAEWI